MRKRMFGSLAMVLCVSAGLLSLAVQDAKADQGLELSIWGGTTSTSGAGSIPYVLDQNTRRVTDQSLGKGTTYGLELGYAVTPDWVANARYEQFSAKGNGRFDSNPSSSTDCNVSPLQGLVSDCYDNADIQVKTNSRNFDLTAGRRFNSGDMKFEGYAGLQYMDFDQNINTSYFYNVRPGGFEEASKRNVKFHGLGPKIGLKGLVPLGSSDFFVKSDLSITQIVDGSRHEDISAPRTNNSVPIQQRNASDSETVHPLVLDLALELGYRITNRSLISLGWRYHEIRDIADTRDTNNPGTTGTLPGSRGIGGRLDNVAFQAIFLKFSQSF